MDAYTYLDRTLAKYAGSFDILKPYRACGVEYDAYASYLSQDEKYVLTRKANLWTVRSHEHVLFRIADDLSEEMIEHAETVIKEHMIPDLVCRGERYPEKDHMYSYLTFVFICNHSPSQATSEQLRSYRFTQNFLFTFRGYAEAHLILVDLEKEQVYTNRNARQMKKFFLSTFEEVRRGMAGYEENCGKVIPFPR